MPVAQQTRAHFGGNMKSIFLRLSNWLENGIVAFCDIVYDSAIIAAIVLAAVVAIPISQVSSLKRDGSIEAFLKHDDPSLLAYNEFRHQFGQDGEIVIGIESDNIFSQAFLKKLTALHKDIERGVPYIEDMTSLYNARDVKGNERDFVVEDLLLHWPESEAEVQAFKKKVMSNQVYRDLLISNDGRFTTITIKPDRFSSEKQSRKPLENFIESIDPDSLNEATGKRSFLSAREVGQLVGAVQKTVAKYDAADFKVYVSGSPTASSTIVQLLLADMAKYMFVSVGAILVFIVLFTRRLVSALLATIIIALTLFTTFGLMAASDVAIKPPTQVLLSIILVASICELIHIVTHFFQKLEIARDKKIALHQTIKQTAIPVLYTSLTTAAGLLAFCSAELAPIADLGWFGATAVFIALLFTWVVVPVCIRLIPVKPKQSASFAASLNDEPKEQAYRWTVALARFSSRRPLLVLACFLPILAVLIFGLTKVRFAHNSLLWLPEDNPVRLATHKIDSVLKGTINLEVVSSTPNQDGVKDKLFLDKLESLTRDIHKLERPDFEIGKAVAVTDILKEINHALHSGDPSHYKIADQALLTQEFVLFENSSSDDLPYFVDSEYTKARFTVRVPWLEASLYSSFIGDVEKLFQDTLGPDYQVTVTGIMALIARTSTAVMQSLAASYINSMILIPIMMMMLLASIRMGLVSMIPNVLPIVMVLGIMGYLNIPLDTFSMMAGSIALGLIVDDSVHFFHNFSRFYSKHQNSRKAIELTIEETGRPIVNASIILAAAFGTYMLASMNNVRDFGLVMVSTIFLALFSDLLLSPALLTLTQKFAKAKFLITPETQNVQA
jgi:predicted RND superfamily exporter protein